MQVGFRTPRIANTTLRKSWELFYNIPGSGNLVQATGIGSTLEETYSEQNYVYEEFYKKPDQLE